MLNIGKVLQNSPLPALDFSAINRRRIGRDPNGFYWKPSRPQYPLQNVELECSQWRHMVAAEVFDFHIHAKLQVGTWTSKLVTKIHAANLTNTAQVHHVLRIVVTEISAVNVAENLVTALKA